MSALAPLAHALGDTLIGIEVCRLTLPGDPTTKARVRFKGKRGFKDAKTAAAETALQWELRRVGTQPDRDHLVSVNLAFRMSTGQRADLDNLVKLVLDACNGFAWGDDLQVSEIHATVDRREANPGLDLVITRIARYTADCRGCGRVLARDQRAFCSRECRWPAKAA